MFSIGLGILEELTFQWFVSSLSMKSFATIATEARMSKFHQFPCIAGVRLQFSKSQSLRWMCLIKTPFQGMQTAQQISLLCIVHNISQYFSSTYFVPSVTSIGQTFQAGPVSCNVPQCIGAWGAAQVTELKAHHSKGEHRLVKSTGTYVTTP